MTKLDEFYLSHKEPIGGCFIALRHIFLTYNEENITEKWYYRLPCFFYKGKLLCYIWTEKKSKMPFIAFYPAHKIDHPLLELGNRTSSKILRIDPEKDIPIELIYEIIDMVIK